MKINSINLATTSYQNSFSSAKAHSNKRNTPPPRPIHDSLVTAGEWFTFGVVLDYFSRKVVFSKSPMKNSIALNSIIAIAAGVTSAIMSLFYRNK